MGNISRIVIGPSRLATSVKSWMNRWSAAKDAASVNSGLNVLVVDDDVSHLDLASEILEKLGISAQLASNGSEAVRLACERRFDIILMDLQMPLMDGLEATFKLRQFEARDARLRTPVVAFSASSVEMALLAASGMDGRLNKPCSVAELEACLVRWCDGFQPCSPLPDLRAGGGRGGG